MYSTCSISPLENDQVVIRALLSVQDQMRISVSSEAQHMLQQSGTKSGDVSGTATKLAEMLHQLGTETTEHGVMVLPDRAGAGPMYACLLHKLATH